jgi:hypothetical protein
MKRTCSVEILTDLSQEAFEALFGTGLGIGYDANGAEMTVLG